MKDDPPMKSFSDTDWSYESGDGKWVKIGVENRNRQVCRGHRGVLGTDNEQYAYKVECLRCGHVYGANGSDMFQRRCPACQGGKPGIPFWAPVSKQLPRKKKRRKK
jgi:hypothetical protein